MKTREKVRAEEVLEGEKERVNLVMQEWEQLKESRELAENRAEQLQNRLHKVWMFYWTTHRLNSSLRYLYNSVSLKS